MSNSEKLKRERTLVLIKPDAIKRGLVGEIIRRIEQRGLKIVALKMFQPNPDDFKEHYPETEEYLRILGRKTLEDYRQSNLDVKKELGTDDELELGKLIRGWLVEFMCSGPLIKMVVEGLHAVKMVRKLVGSTMPADAEMGTIRGDFSVDSAILANSQKRAVHNLVHASGTLEEAKKEINLWFSPEEIQEYDLKI